MGRYCPSSYKATLQRIQSLGCDQRYEYHCMRNKKDEMVEKCIEISWIQEGKCAVYDTDAQLIDSWKCNSTRGVCPQKQYLSNEVMSYSACVPLYTPSNVTDGSNENTSKIPSDKSRFDNNDSISLPLVTVSVIALISVIAIIVITVLYKRRKGSPRGRSSQDLPATKTYDEEKGLSDPEERIPLNAWTGENEEPGSSREDTGYGIDPYYKTKTYEHIEKLLEDSAVSILIVGHPGSGKSVLINMLHDLFRRKQGKERYHISKYIKSLEDVESCKPQENTKLMYFVDDCFENWIQYPHLAYAGIEKLIQIHNNSVIIEGNCLAITMSKLNFDENLDITQQAQLKQCDKLEVVDLTTNKFELDITDKTGILEYHRKKRGSKAQRMDDYEVQKVTNPGILQSIVSYLECDTKLEFEFPLSCRLFYSHDSFVTQKEYFFTQTKRKIRAYVRQLSSGTLEERNQYCSLIYVTLCGGQIEAHKKHDISFLRKIALSAQIDTHNLDFNFDCCLIIKGKQETYEIVHEEITKLLFSSFGYNRTDLLIDNCETEVLLKFVRSNDWQRRIQHRRMELLVITNNMYDRMFFKLQEAHANCKHHAIFKDDDFHEKFENFVSANQLINEGTEGQPE